MHTQMALFAKCNTHIPTICSTNVMEAQVRTPRLKRLSRYWKIRTEKENYHPYGIANRKAKLLHL